MRPELNPMLPRVNPANGQILEQIKPPNKTQPLSISGYCDWLYSRRNAIVHGGGATKLMAHDRAHLTKMFKCDPPESMKIKLSSVSNAATFYLGVVGLLGESV